MMKITTQDEFGRKHVLASAQVSPFGRALEHIGDLEMSKNP
jgi:hypothetical protein